jgi:hypothetical protein
VRKIQNEDVVVFKREGRERGEREEIGERGKR